MNKYLQISGMSSKLKIKSSCDGGGVGGGDGGGGGDDRGGGDGGSGGDDCTLDDIADGDGHTSDKQKLFTTTQ